MSLTIVKASDLQPGMLLYGWTKEATEERDPWSILLQEGPDGGPWQGMVVSNTVNQERMEGFDDRFDYPAIRLIRVMFWNDKSRIKLWDFYWTEGTVTRVID
jgi:hypothetical protein